ncbi:SNF1 protein kinase subunit beta-3 [Golovinomyces cichoracearum]|uniref:SNF1 protein kinase subunit beta-3 n=1 Tax=Golovinomyces cichoracearum TaxID=62708 RepID=A0A420HWH8_9PEZI|nr:SNF1 protein kinase subunit beta-3 [Golovinomyces cichoracearum]
MGNNPSANSKSLNSSSNTSSVHETSRIFTSRRDPRNLIHAQRTPVEPSFTQALGTPTTYRTRRSSHSANTHLNQPTSTSSTPAAGGSSNKDALSEPKEESNIIIAHDQPSKPVDVPLLASNSENVARNPKQNIESSELNLLQDSSYDLTRPPRLPLPIEEEVHTPGSPIISPADVETPLLDLELLENEALQRQASNLSNSTIDEEDAEELGVDRTKPIIPVTFEWAHGGEKIYVTGTIFQWNKKHCLHPVKGRPGLFRAVINVRPGTHHIRFIKDTVMLCSPDLPTTVDFGNNLVNYIEVSADELLEDDKQSAPASALQKSEFHAQELSPQIQRDPNAPSEVNPETVKPLLKSRLIIPQNRYTSQIPQYLLDLDKSEDCVEYRNATAAIEKFPAPPSLPGFLGKPILNAATPLKDDNSVLIMPNHSVLNHLATSSIKNEVLAVSVTTRYKRKYVTTIMYKPMTN